MWRERNPKRAAEIMLKTRLKAYGLTIEGYQHLVAKQGNRCAACGTSEYGRKDASRWAIDHDHLTGEVRGLLCSQCNVALGQLADDWQRVALLLEYAKERCMVPQ